MRHLSIARLGGVAPAPVTLLILAPMPPAGAGPLERLLDEAVVDVADRHRRALEALGVTRASTERSPRDEAAFGAHLRRLVMDLRPRGLIVLGGGSMPLATSHDWRDFLDAAAAEDGALTNNAFSGDAIAIARAADVLADLPPDLPNDNALPRWLREVAGVTVRDLRGRRRLAVDIDSPLDLLLLESARGGASGGFPVPDDRDAALVRERLVRLRALATDPSAELLVAGRMAAVDLRRLETRTRSRTRALIEERGMRTAALAAMRGEPNRRPARTTIGTLLERDGPGALGDLLATLSDGALVDTRVLLAQRFGLDERGWPHPEDRYSSDLLLPHRVSGPMAPGAHQVRSGRIDPDPPRRAHAGWPGRRARARDRAGARARQPGGRQRGRPVSWEPGYRREALPDPESVGEDEELVRRIRMEIAERGPITFARFMDRALYEPGHGYYRRPDAAPGRGGDFLTAPEAHPIFGAVIGRLLEQAWDALDRPDPFVVTEPGAGTGALAAGLLGGLRDLESPLLEAIRYRPVEVEPARIEALRARLAAAGLDGAWPAGDEPGRDETGAVVANEVVDALPVHRVVGRPGGIRELLVTTGPDGAFEPLEAEPTTPALAERLRSEGVTLADGQVTEICLALDGWLATATSHLARGVVVLIDYAEEPGTLHAATRPTGTLRAFARHAVGGDPFRHVGRQDLTATVDLAAVRAAAARAGLLSIGETTQAELIAALGTGDLAQAFLRRPGASLQDALDFRSALARLLDPRGMGGFRVLAFGRGLSGETRLDGLRRLVPPTG